MNLNHSNIVRLHDANILSIPSYIIFNVAEGLKHAHSKSIAHRDLKPSNVLLKAGVPKVSDWGLSEVLSESRHTTLANFTPYYATPEQVSRRFGNPTNGKLERAAELFDSLYPPISGNLVEFFVPVIFALEKRYESKDIAEILLGVLNPYLNELRVRIELRDDEKFSPEEKSFTLTLRKGEKFVKRVGVKRLEDTGWYWFEAIFRVENYEAEFVKLLSLMDEGEVLFRWALVETEPKKKLNCSKKAASMGHEEAKKELLRRFIKPLKQGLSRSFVVEIPRLVEGVESIMRMSIKNDLAEQLKLTVSLSGNDFLELDEEEIEFPKLGRGHEASKKLE